MDGPAAERVASLFDQYLPQYGKIYMYTLYDKNKDEHVIYEYIHTGYRRGLQVNKATRATRKIRNEPHNDPTDSPVELDDTHSQLLAEESSKSRRLSDT